MILYFCGCQHSYRQLFQYSSQKEQHEGVETMDLPNGHLFFFVASLALSECAEFSYWKSLLLDLAMLNDGISFCNSSLQRAEVVTVQSMKAVMPHQQHRKDSTLVSACFAVQACQRTAQLFQMAADNPLVAEWLLLCWIAAVSVVYRQI